MLDPNGPEIRVPDDAEEAVLQRTLEMARDGEWDQAVDRLRDALSDHPESPYILCWLGVAERELGLEGIAYERFKRALALEPQDPVLLTTVGNALARFDDPEAEAALRTAAMIAPQSAPARCAYGAYLSREGMLDRAVEELEAALRLEPADPLVHLELGVVRALEGEMTAAAHFFGQAAELTPDDGWAHILLGLAWVELEEMEEAARALEEGARLRPDDLEAQLLAALVLAIRERHSEALEMLERARLRATEVDEALVLEVEDLLEDPGGAARRFLLRTLAPSSFRERLVQHP